MILLIGRTWTWYVSHVWARHFLNFTRLHRMKVLRTDRQVLKKKYIYIYQKRTHTIVLNKKIIIFQTLLHDWNSLQYRFHTWVSTLNHSHRQPTQHWQYFKKSLSYGTIAPYLPKARPRSQLVLLVRYLFEILFSTSVMHSH